MSFPVRATCVLAVLLDTCGPVCGQRADSGHYRPHNTIELRADLDEFVRFEGEYGHYWTSFLKGDVLLASGQYTILNLGLTIEPLPIVFIQPSIGIAAGGERVTDGPDFSPDRDYQLRGGVLIPLGPPRSGVYASMAGRVVTLVQAEIRRTIRSFSLGVGFKF
jgi:hypothetical protein